MKTIHNLVIALLGLALVPCLYSAKPPNPTPAPAPSELTATALAPDRIQLTWKDNSSDEIQFNLERATSVQFAGVVVSAIPANATQYTDTGLQSGTLYYYRIRAKTKRSLSSYSNVASATTPVAPPPPAAPSNLAATALDATQIRLTWTDNSTDETQFKLERSTDAFRSKTEILIDANATEFTDSGLQPNTAYSYRLRACNAGGCSDYSNVASPSRGIIVGAWTPIFLGVEHATGLDSIATQAVNVLRVDLQATGIRVNSTPRSANYRPETEETKGMTASHYLINNQLQAVINGNWFLPCCTGLDGSPIELLGLAISSNIVVSSQESKEKATAMVIDANNNAAMIAMNWPPVDNTAIDSAVAGKNAVLLNGLYVGTNVLVDCRSALGISQDKRYLILMTIDGRQPGYSVGASDADTAAWMERFGAYDAFNLDGGGSTTMAVDDGVGGSLVLNRPSGGIERAVGNHLGIYAQPLSASAAVLLGQTPQPKLAPEEEFLLQVIADSLVDPTPHLTVTPFGIGQQRLRVKGLPDYTYQIQVTESLANPNWQPLANGRANELGEFDVIDAVRSAPRHYRALHR